jgi:hypothetical protein
MGVRIDPSRIDEKDFLYNAGPQLQLLPRIDDEKTTLYNAGALQQHRLG